MSTLGQKEKRMTKKKLEGWDSSCHGKEDLEVDICSDREYVENGMERWPRLQIYGYDNENVDIQNNLYQDMLIFGFSNALNILNISNTHLICKQQYIIQLN